jgi:hypothetical protein
MNFLSLKTRVAEETGLDLTTDATKLGVWVNEAYKFIASLRNWSWLIKDGVFQTQDDLEPTASITHDTDDVIVSAIGTSESIQANYMIQFPTKSDDWYLITSHTAGQSAFTISPVYTDTTLASAACILRKVSYSLARDVDKLIDFREMINNRILPVWDIRDYDQSIPDPNRLGDPQNVVLTGMDTSTDTTGTYQYWKVTLDPIPDSAMNIHYRYYQIVSELIGNTSMPLIPEPWHQVIVWVALATFGHPYIDDSRMQFASIRAKQMLNDMVQGSEVVPGKFNQIQAWDNRGGNRTHGAAWPPDFNPYGR